jgi:hypothetical protein
MFSIPNILNQLNSTLFHYYTFFRVPTEIIFSLEGKQCTSARGKMLVYVI